MPQDRHQCQTATNIKTPRREDVKMPRGSRATQVLTWVAAAAVLLCFLTFLGCTVAAVSVLPGVRAKSLPVALPVFAERI